MLECEVVTLNKPKKKCIHKRNADQVTQNKISLKHLFYGPLQTNAFTSIFPHFCGMFSETKSNFFVLTLPNIYSTENHLMWSIKCVGMITNTPYE